MFPSTRARRSVWSEPRRYMAVGTSLGLRIFSTFPLTLRYVYGSIVGDVAIEGSSVRIVEMIYMLDQLLVVGKEERSAFTPKRLSLWNTERTQIDNEVAFPSPILYVQANGTTYSLPSPIEWSFSFMVTLMCCGCRASQTALGYIYTILVPSLKTRISYSPLALAANAPSLPGSTAAPLTVSSSATQRPAKEWAAWS